MAHIIKYELIDFAGPELSAQGTAIYEAYAADGRITVRVENVDNVHNVYLTFADRATSDAYFAEMEASGETAKTGHKRADMIRYDEE